MFSNNLNVDRLAEVGERTGSKGNLLNVIGVVGLTRELDQKLVSVASAFVGEGNLTTLIVAGIPLCERCVDI